MRLHDPTGARPAIGAAFQTRVRYEEPMSAHSSWHAGGNAQVYYSPRDADELAAFLRALPLAVPVYWVGLGTNLLVRAGGVRGVVIATPGVFTRIERRSQTRVRCEASVPCARIARCCANWELSEGEFFSGIPGTLGGALAMNAGAFGDETWRHVVAVETISRSGQRKGHQAAEFRVGYREVALGSTGGAAELRQPPEQEWFLAAELQFDASATGAAAATANLKALLQRRRETQPLGSWSCGSVFKNPPGDHAARLIETAGLKGYRIGDAVVSEKHANFIINVGAARPQDLEQLISHVRATVQRLHGVTLEPEVRIIGEGGSETRSAAAAVEAGGSR